jgi:hypothetical protein
MSGYWFMSQLVIETHDDTLTSRLFIQDRHSEELPPKQVRQGDMHGLQVLDDVSPYWPFGQVDTQEAELKKKPVLHV